MERDKQYLLYFGSVFLWSEVEAVPGIGHFMEPPKVLKDAISMDIAVLRSARFLDKKKGSISWTITGRFMQVPDTNMWLYQHSNHVNCSAAMYENFLSMCKVNKQAPPKHLPECRAHTQHDALEPFFRDNVTLQLFYQCEMSRLQEGDRRRQYLEGKLEKVTAILDGHINHEDTPFCSPGLPELRPTQFNEDAWSKRLAYSLMEFLPDNLGSGVNYTAKDGPSFGLKQSIKSGVPNESYLLSFYPFQGVSDISIKNSPIIMARPINEEDDQTSGEECSIENGRQADPLMTSVPPKIGELLASMHISLVQKIVRMFKLKINKAKERKEVKTRGMYVHKSLGNIVCTMTIPVIKIGSRNQESRNQRMTIALADLTMGQLTTQQLCYSLSYMLDREIPY